MRRKNEPSDVWLNIAIPPDGDIVPCWPWSLELNPTDGRPYFTVAGVRWLAYRLVYTQVHGPIPEGLVVRHRCDNSACCNPEHLELGAQSDNENDKYDRDRYGFPNEVLTAIMKYSKANMPQQLIAETCTQLFGIIVTQQRVSDIITGTRRQKQTGAKT